MSAWHNSPAWRALALQAKRRDGWRCVRCGSRLRLEVDHIEPRERRPDLALSLSNLQTLCRNCHLTKSGEDRGALAIPGAKEWRDAVRRLLIKP